MMLCLPGMASGRLCRTGNPLTSQDGENNGCSCWATTNQASDLAAPSLCKCGYPVREPVEKPADDRVPHASGHALIRGAVAEDIDMIGPMALRLHVEVHGAGDVYLFADPRRCRGAIRRLAWLSGDMVSKGWRPASWWMNSPQPNAQMTSLPRGTLQHDRKPL